MSTPALRVAELEAALRKLRPYFGKLEAELTLDRAGYREMAKEVYALRLKLSDLIREHTR